jgi:hypothetical protein
MENYTLIVRNNMIPRNPEPLYVDPFGFVNTAPTNESNNCYDSFPVHVKRPSDCKKCHFVGHHRRCPSPKKKMRENWNNIITRETQGLDHPYLFDQFDENHLPPDRMFAMQYKPAHDTKPPKSHLAAHGCTNDQFTGAYHQAARKHSEEIFNENWNKKERIRAARNHDSVPYTRIERAFMTSAISYTTEGEIEHDEEKAKNTASALKTEFDHIDMAEQMKSQQTQIEHLT